MAHCKECKRKFHACFSCGLFYEEWDFCSKKCYNFAGNPIYDAYGLCETLDITLFCKECNPDKNSPTNYTHVHVDNETSIKCCSNCETSEFLCTY